MAIRIAINGFGRIGRHALRAVTSCETDDLKVVAVNDLAPIDTLAHLLRYDSVHGRYPGSVEIGGDGLVVDDRLVRVLSEARPEALPWADLGVDVVLESTGRFTKRADAAQHLTAGARKVLISAPGRDVDATLVLGVNDNTYRPSDHHVISNASCTTNCLAPVVKVIAEFFGFVRGLVTTIHSYTNGQNILDFPHKDLRRARAAALSMIPTTTGAARATALVLPEVTGRIDGLSVRVPTADVSLVDLVAEVRTDVTAHQVNEAMRRAARSALANILDVCDEPLVSVDYIGNPASAVVDSASTAVIDGRMVKVLAWYDNEWGYANRLIDLAALVGS